MRVHHRRTDSTNERARELAASGAPHLTVVTASEQTAGRGRQGRTWSAPPGTALLMSVLLRDFDRLLPLRGGLAVADACGDDARVKWPNDVLLGGRKVAGILVEGRLQEGWAVIGIGVNVAVDPAELPDELRDRAATLGRAREEIEPFLDGLLEHLGRRLAQTPETVLADLRARDALLGRPVHWSAGSGTGAGISDDGALVVALADGTTTTLDAGEVHLGTP